MKHLTRSFCYVFYTLPYCMHFLLIKTRKKALIIFNKTAEQISDSLPNKNKPGLNLSQSSTF